ncbi:MAG TPA: hypothetical protein VN207_05090 [Ktedonobacteraceae bacterium]|nr:hypothetical protein [Ktedonobacteraceae bacterium]
MPYPSDIQAQMQQVMSEQRAKLETAYDADPKVKSAKDALEQAKEHLVDEKTIQANLDRDRDWHRYSDWQKANVRGQMGTRVQDAENAVRTAEKDVNVAIGNHIRESQQATQDAAKAELDRLGKVEQEKFAKQEEEKAKLSFRSNYMVAGGTSDQFEKAWPDLWQSELARRAMGSHDAMTQKLISSGRYNVAL